MSVEDQKHHEIRAAELSIDRTPDEGVTMTIQAGALRLRLFIDGQWSDLVQQIEKGEGTLGDMVPFRMKPIPVSALADEVDSDSDSDGVVSSRTLRAYEIPGISREDPEYQTPLWKGAFPSLRVEEE